jgi:hypothetical protein
VEYGVKQVIFTVSADVAEVSEVHEGFMNALPTHAKASEKGPTFMTSSSTHHEPMTSTLLRHIACPEIPKPKINHLLSELTNVRELGNVLLVFPDELDGWPSKIIGTGVWDE